MNIVSSRTLGIIVIAGVMYNLLVILAMHVLEPDFNPIRVPMSAYVLGAYGALMTTSYFVWCIALLSMGYALATTLPPTRVTRAAFVLVLIAAAAILLGGIFPIEFPGPPRTLSGRLHLLGGLIAFPTMAVGLFLFSLSFRRDRNWENVSVAGLLLASGIIGVFVLAITSIVILGYAGYLQRVYIALLSGWMIVVALHLIRAKPITAATGANSVVG